jgi:hypothetical protein
LPLESLTHYCNDCLRAPEQRANSVLFSKEGLSFREARGAARYGALAVGVGLWYVSLIARRFCVAIALLPLIRCDLGVASILQNSLILLSTGSRILTA